MLAISDAKDLCYDKMIPLEATGLKIPLKEVLVAKTFIERRREQFEEEREKEKDVRFATRFNLLMELYLKKEIFPEVYRFIANVDTFGCSTSVLLFRTALERIGKPSRLLMTNERLRNLSFLAFESKKLHEIDVEEISMQIRTDGFNCINVYRLQYIPYSELILLGFT